jgi:hypothetical protein
MKKDVTTVDFCLMFRPWSRFAEGRERAVPVATTRLPQQPRRFATFEKRPGRVVLSGGVFPEQTVDRNPLSAHGTGFRFYPVACASQ